VLLQRLASEYLFAELTRAVMESLASENGARLRVMEAADHNTGDKLEGLRRSENALRQEAITSELLDVVTGSEAILKSVNR
jgi:F-type H+-transporting ATPase subunit gamma